jgi:hypothetical protein
VYSRDDDDPSGVAAFISAPDLICAKEIYPGRRPRS